MYISSQILIEYPPKANYGWFHLSSGQPTSNSELTVSWPFQGTQFISPLGLCFLFLLVHPKLLNLCLVLTFSRTWTSVVSQPISQPRYHSFMSNCFIYSFIQLIFIEHISYARFWDKHFRKNSIHDRKSPVLIEKTEMEKKSLSWMITVYSII